MRFVFPVHLTALVLLGTSACESLPITVAPGCDISEERLTYGSYDPVESYIFVMDPEVRRMGPAHLSRIEASLLDFMRLRVDGRLWVEPFYPYALAPTVVRLAVILVDGTIISTELPTLPSLPRDAEALMQDGVEVWVEHDAWKAWFLEVFARRIHDALTRESSTLSSPMKAATRFAETHPDFANPHVIVLTSRDDDSQMSASRVFPGLVVIGAAPNQPTTDGSREPRHGSIQAQIDLHGFTEEAMRCDDGTSAGVFPHALLSSTLGIQNTSFFSLCEFDIRDASIPRLATADGAQPNSLYRPMSPHLDGTVDCVMTVLLPSSGPRRHCADFDFSRLTIEGDGAFTRERCDVPQLTHDLADARIGFRYEQTEPMTFWTGYRLVLNSARIPVGTSTEIRCWRGNDACGFNGSLADAGSDAR